ncbi:MAG: DUF883 family protein [Undibacterium sp.]|nr:DUF883 family protein [Opitutaceae bacterium]
MSKKYSAMLSDQADSTIEELRGLLAEAEQALSSAGDAATDEVQALRERLRGVLAEGQATLKNVTAAARRQAARADETIRENPYQAIGIAAAVGLLAGYLVSRNCSDSR